MNQYEGSRLLASDFFCLFDLDHSNVFDLLFLYVATPGQGLYRVKGKFTVTKVQLPVSVCLADSCSVAHFSRDVDLLSRLLVSAYFAGGWSRPPGF